MRRLTMAALLAAAALAPSARAQAIPGGLGGVSGAPAAASGLGGVGAIAAPQKTIWGFFGISKANCAACKQKLCNSQIGQLMNNGLAPVSGLTGGLIPQFCPAAPTAAQAAALGKSLGPNSAVAAAAAIKANEADAKARVAAVEYLGTVDCNYWGVAQDSLLQSLRADPNECVRYAAARVLSNGCCCSRLTIQSLTITVMGMAAAGPNGKATDTFPAENSERVRCAAMVALQNCLPIVPPEPPKVIESTPDGPAAPKPAPPLGDGPAALPMTAVSKDDSLARAAYIRALNKKPAAEILADARLALELFGRREASLTLTGNRTLANAIARARVAPKAAAASASAATTPTPVAPPAAEMAPTPPEAVAPAVEVLPPAPAEPPLPTNIPMPADAPGPSAARAPTSYRTIAHTAAKPAPPAAATSARPSRSLATVLAGDLRGPGVASR